MIIAKIITDAPIISPNAHPGNPSSGEFGVVIEWKPNYVGI